MSHRAVNNVGYKKIYPMSLLEDDSFCHYCGRAADILNPLEWDHVPALNVKIPEEYADIRKTLIRCCKECNLLASDSPHLDYLERHFWLKAAYLRRYKRLLINEDDFEDLDKYDDSFLRATIGNAKLRYEQLLSGIGFGIKDVTQIDSPILNVKTKKGRKISNLLLGYLKGFPTEQEEEDEEHQVKTDCKTESKTDTVKYCTYQNFIEFLEAEHFAGIKIEGQEDYQNWIEKHPSRSINLDLPSHPEEAYFTTWFLIASEIRRVNQTLEQQTGSQLDWTDEPCSIAEFTECLACECFVHHIETESKYLAWCYNNPHIVEDYRLPQNPCLFYDRDWSELLIYVMKKKNNRKIKY